MLYLVNKNSQISTGDHKIHITTCKVKPKYQNTLDLGDFSNPFAAQDEARKHYINVNGCKYCCKKIFLKK